jgi:hypothetical protein
MVAVPWMGYLIVDIAVVTVTLTVVAIVVAVMVVRVVSGAAITAARVRKQC